MVQTLHGNYNALSWVQDDLQKSLSEALESFTQYIEEPTHRVPLESCITQLYQARGTVSMLNLKGAHLLAQEIFDSATLLMGDQVNNHLLIQDSILKGLLLLPNYLQILSLKLQDHPLRLISTINELRLARGETKLHAYSLFEAQRIAQIPKVILSRTESDSNNKVSLNDISRAFQASLLHWFKEDDTTSLRRLGNALHHLRSYSTQDSSIELWWAGEGVVEALLNDGLTINHEIKLKIGELSTSIKRFAMGGDSHLQSKFPTQLFHELLLFVAKATSNGKHVFLLKNTFDLSFFNVEQHQRTYRSSGGAVDGVHAELLIQLEEIKERVDQFDRNSDQSVEMLEHLPAQLSEIAQTLKLLSENISSVLLQKQAKQLRALFKRRDIPNNKQLMTLANFLLYVESHLQKNTRINSALAVDHSQLHNIILRECQTDLNTIKESLPLLSGNADNSLVTTIPSKLKDLGGSLAMINLDSAADLFQNTALHLSHTLENQKIISEKELDWFADIIAYTDLYMENICQGGKPQPSLLLDGQNTLEKLSPRPAAQDIPPIVEEDVAPDHNEPSLVGSSLEFSSEEKLELNDVDLTSEDSSLEFDSEEKLELNDIDLTSEDISLEFDSEEKLELNNVELTSEDSSLEFDSEEKLELNNVELTSEGSSLEFDSEEKLELNDVELTSEGSSLEFDSEEKLELNDVELTSEDIPLEFDSEEKLELNDADLISEDISLEFDSEEKLELDDADLISEDISLEFDSEEKLELDDADLISEDISLEFASEEEVELNNVQPFPISSNILRKSSSVEQYINNLSSVKLPELIKNEVLEPNIETSVEKYINQSSSTVLTDNSESNIETIDIRKPETSVDQYINKHSNSILIDDLEPVIEKTDLTKIVTPHNSGTSNPTLHIVENSIPDTISNEILKPEITIDQESETTRLSLDPVSPETKSIFPDNIDPDIAEIFIEEAEEIFSDLDELIPQWKSQHKTETLAVIRRHFHTLKGGGNIVGITTIGELSWAAENLLNKALNASVNITPEIDSFISDSTQSLRHLIVRFSEGELLPLEHVEALIKQAATLSESPINPKDVLLEHPDQRVETTPETLSEDTELQEIFNSEAIQHITTFKDFFAHSSPPFTIEKELLRAAHSLKGCSNIAQIIPVATVATQLEQALRVLYESSHIIYEEKSSLLIEIIDGVEQFISHLMSPLSEKPNLLPLSEKITQLFPDVETSSADTHTDEQLKLIDPEFLATFLEETDELLEQYAQNLKEYQQQPENINLKESIHSTLESLIDGAQQVEHSPLIEIYGSLQKLIEYRSINDFESLAVIEQGDEEINGQIENLLQNKAPNDVAQFVSSVEQLLARSTVEPTILRETETETSLIENNINDYVVPQDDPELLGAFTEECAELLESSNIAINNWQKDHNDTDAALQLQRVLHTIKGGARLTNVLPIADLTHNTESLVFLIADNKLTASDKFYSLLQRSQDRLSVMQEHLARNENIPLALDLLSEIAAFSGQPAPITPDVLKENSAAPVIPNKPTVDVTAPAVAGEQIRVRADLLDFLTNFTGEVNISRDRVSRQNTAIQYQLTEMESTVTRLKGQLRNLEIETETQILFRYDDAAQDDKSDFDPLELDRFSMIQQLSRSLTESVSDMNEITHSIDSLVRDSDAILLQQSRLSVELEQSLINSRLLPFTGLVPRFERIVRQINSDLDKQSLILIVGAEHELDRTILERITAPLEHLIRNAIAHGVESPESRKKLGKNEIGQITLTISREGSEILLSLADDGQGIDVEKVRKEALKRALINPQNMPSDDDLVQLILTSGFSTADNLSQISGRGVGMDVVSSEIRALKGRLSIQSIPGSGTTFNIRLPLTLSIMQALLIRSHEKQFAIPLTAVHASSRILVSDLQKLLEEGNEEKYEFNGEYYQLTPLANLLDQPLVLPDDPKEQMPLLLFRYGNDHIALLVDSVISNSEIVLKSIGKQLNHINSIIGATILGDGNVVFILDIPVLIGSASISHISTAEELSIEASDLEHRTPIAMIVDDSITVRKVSSNLLKRLGFDIVTAKDGIDAVAQLNDVLPDIILLDIEMPRMDGFEFAALVRNIEQYVNIPIIMITSRTGEKHRTRAMDLGVNAYLGKPYQETELVETMQTLLGSSYPLLEK